MNIRHLAAAAALFALSAFHASTESHSAGMHVAAGSCTSTYNTCASRCRRDNPQDVACPSDHCAPKLASCKSTGCWQEGQRYGGALTCDLKRS